MPRHSILALRLLLLLPLPATACFAAPPKLDYLFPAGAARGETAAVTAYGAFSNWPVDAWVDRPGVRVEAEKDKGKLKIIVDADAEPGVCFVRLHDREGASTLRPFYVGTLAETLEKEPNDEPDAPQRLAASTIVNGRLEKRGDVDTYAIEVKQGQTLVASLRAHTQLGSPVDSVLQVCTADNFVLLQNDDEHGLDPQITIEAPSDGVYLVRAFGFPAVPNSSIAFAGAENFVYRLTITTGPFVDHALPLAAARDSETAVKLHGWNLPVDLPPVVIPPGDDDALVHLPQTARQEPRPPGDPQEPRPPGIALLANTLNLARVDAPLVIVGEKASPDEPQPLELPCVVSGRLERRRQIHAFQFSAAKGQRLNFRVESAALGYPLDALLSVVDATGKVVSEVDDTGGSSDALVAFTAPADGQYKLLLRDLHDRGGFRFAYRLTCGPPRPDFALTVAAGEFVLAAGKTLEIPVTIDRRDGFKEEIAVSVEGLPEGVSVEEQTSAATGATAKTVKLTLKAAESVPASSLSIRVVGRSGETPRAATFSLAGLTGQAHSGVWLTVTGK